MNYEKESFGQRLRKLRKKAGLTQGELAYQIGVHEVTLRRWETEGRKLNNFSTIKKLAKVLHVSEEELLNGTPENENTWVLHVVIGKDDDEEYIDMKKPKCFILTSDDGAFLKIGGIYDLWTDDKLFNQIIKDFKRLRSTVIQNGKALGGIKEQ